MLGPPLLSPLAEPEEDEEEDAWLPLVCWLSDEAGSLDASVTVSEGPKDTVRLGVDPGRNSVMFYARGRRREGDRSASPREKGDGDDDDVDDNDHRRRVGWTGLGSDAGAEAEIGRTPPIRGVVR